MRSLMGLRSPSVLMHCLIALLVVGAPMLFMSAGASANPLPAGACCFTDGHCEWADEVGCAQLGGMYMGDLTSCVPNPCEAFGVCCSPDGSCMVSAPQACQGNYLAWVTTCDPNPCPPCKLPCGSSACCLPNGDCLFISEDECVGQGGLVQGSAITCTPDPCATSGINDEGPVPGPKVEKQSWGKIKSRFR
jgi:hypothetical protein